MLAQQLVNGLVLGSTYALFALGFTLMFGVLGVINLTYGFYFSAGAMIALFATRFAASPLWLALPAAAVLSGMIAMVFDEVLITPLRKARAPELASLMVTLGATLLLYSLASAVFTTDIRRFPAAVLDASAFEIAGIRITSAQMLIVGTAIAIVVVLLLLMQRTRLGLMVRGLAENRDTAELMGVNTRLVERFVSFLSGLLGGAAGVLIGLNSNAIQPYMGETMMLKGFAVIILGGLGDIRGALLAGLIIGMLETLTAGYVGSSLKDLVGFLLLVLTLWVRPNGLLGQRALKRA